MNLSSRSLGLALLLLLLFLGTAVTLQWWLRRETRQLQGMAVEDLRGRLARTVAVSGRTPDQWDPGFLRELGAMLGASVEVYRTETTPAVPAAAGSVLQFTQEIAGSPDWRLRVTFAPPALIRVQILHQRILAAIVLLSLLLAIVPLLLALLDSRRALGPDSGTRSPWSSARASAVGMEHFAKISYERTAALAQEHDARLRAEQDLQVNRTLLDRSVDERIRLGRELHDNICQTLYAVCLTLESVQKKNTLAPELSQRVDQCMTELRRLNQEVRSFLQQLEPARMHGQSFAGALTGLIKSFTMDEEVRIEQRLDEEAVALIPSAQFPEIMNILREAVSNSLRHGRARHITLLAGRNDQQIALAVQDDGAGFVPARPRPAAGHGLGNMQARAAALGGSLRIESVPGKGTRVLLTLPVASPS
ncbi:MAG: histidine kinase [Lacunisphaera sp.]|nr:histidine kinase [Lacunisphaera sp.]